jgi:hypothetical protein
MDPKQKKTEDVRFMRTDPAKKENNPEIKEIQAKADKAAGDIIHEMLERKEALLKVALEYNAFAGQFNQEAVAIDFKTGLHGPLCRISLRDSLQKEIHDRCYILDQAPLRRAHLQRP